jgi:hypothetical protein
VSIQAIRFRAEGDKVVLQVKEYTEGRSSPHFYERTDAVVAWRDAEVEDLLDVSRFTADQSEIAKRLNDLESRVEWMQQPAERA